MQTETRTSTVRRSSTTGKRRSTAGGSGESKTALLRGAAASIGSLLRAAKEANVDLPLGWVYFSERIQQVHLLWIYDAEKLKADHKEKSSILRNWLEVLGETAELNVWLDTLSYQMMCKDSLFLSQGYSVKFRNVEDLYGSFIRRANRSERSPEGFASEAESKIFNLRLYIRAAYAATTLRRQEQQQAAGEEMLVEESKKDEPVRMLIDLFKHLIVLECSGLCVDWDVDPFDVSKVVEKHKGITDKKESVLFSTEKENPLRWLYYKRYSIKCVSKLLEDQVNVPEDQENLKFVRKIDENRIVCPEKTEDQAVIDNFHLKTACAMYKALREAADLLGSLGDTDSYFDLYEKTKKGQLKGNQKLKREAALTSQMLDTINWFSEIYKPNLTNVFTLDIAI